MAHAIFNISPVRFLSSIQDHVFTSAPAERVAVNTPVQSPPTCTNSSKRHQESPCSDRDSVPSVTLQLTLPVENHIEESQLSSSLPIDIPKSQPYSLNVSTHSMNDGLTANYMLSASYNSSVNGQNNSLLDNSNVGVNSPNHADDLTVFFDNLAVHSPVGSYCGGSPNQGCSPVYSNVGSPQSPMYFNSPVYHHGNNGTTQDNQNFLAGSPFSNALLGSPCSPYFLGSPANGSFVGDVQADPNSYGQVSPHQQPLNPDQSSSPCNNLSYLSPSLSATTQVTPINSPSPHSYTEHYLFPPTLPTISRPPSPGPGDVILTPTEVSDYISTPQYHPSISPNVSQNTSPSAGPLSVITDAGYYFETAPQPLEMYDNTNMTNEDVELFPASLVTVSPHHHTQPQPGDDNNYLSVIPNNNMFSSDDDVPKTSPTSPIIRTTPSGRRAKIHHCPYCNHTSNRANNMREHVQIHNPNRPKPHACKLCGRAFARKHDMNRHYISCKKQLEKVSNEVAVSS